MRRWLQTLFHNPSTAFPQAEILAKLSAQTQEIAELDHKFVLLRRNVDDFEERTARRLDRWRKWFTSRKGGKFESQAMEAAAESPNGRRLVPGDTHESIAKAAKEQGLIS